MTAAIKGQTLRVEDVPERRGLARFLAVGRAVYAGSRCRFLTDEIPIRELVGRRSCFRDHARVESCLVVDGTRDVARFCLVHDRLLPDRVQVAYFEALPGLEGLADVVADAARRRFPGVPRLVAGLNGHLDLGAGFLLDAFDAPQIFGLPYSPPYYPDYFAGFDAIALASYRFRVRDYVAFGVDAGAGADARIRVRALDFGAFERDVRIYNALCNECFRGHPFWSERPLADDLEDFRSLRPFLRSEYLLFAEEAGKPVGFLLWFPDFHEMGRPGRAVSLCDRLRLWRADPRTDFRSFLIATIAHLPGHAANAVPVALFAHLAAIVRGSRFESFEGGFIFADNARSTGMTRRLATMIAGRAPTPYRRYAIYERALGD